SDLGALAQVAHQAEQPRLTAALGGPPDDAVAPALRQLGEMAAVAVTADEQRDALPAPRVEQRQDTAVPQDVHDRSLQPVGVFYVLPAADPIAPGGGEEAEQRRAHSRSQAVGPAQPHPSSSSASLATRSAANTGSGSPRWMWIAPGRS